MFSGEEIPTVKQTPQNLKVIMDAIAIYKLRQRQNAIVAEFNTKNREQQASASNLVAINRQKKGWTRILPA